MDKQTNIHTGTEPCIFSPEHSLWDGCQEISYCLSPQKELALGYSGPTMYISLQWYVHLL